MKFLKGLIALSIFSLIMFSTSALLAQDDIPKNVLDLPGSKVEEKVEKKVEEKVEKPIEAVKEDLKIKEKTSGNECECGAEADKAIEIAYDSLEEDDWEDAIDVCKKTVSTIAALEKTCKCIEVSAYSNIATAFVSYAQGGKQLDEDEEIDCEGATKLYRQAITLIESALPKIKNETTKEYASEVGEFCNEEIEFTAEECE